MARACRKFAVASEVVGKNTQTYLIQTAVMRKTCVQALAALVSLIGAATSFRANGAVYQEAGGVVVVEAEHFDTRVADPADATQVGAPMPGMVASIAVSIGQKVKEGETLLTLEAMKMFAAISAPAAGTVKEICVKVGESVESKDLLIRLAK